VKLLNIFRSKQFIKFVLTGGFAALVNFVSRILLDIFLSFSLSVVLAYFVGMCTAFILNKLFVFEQADNRTGWQALMFVAVNLLAVLQTYVISVGLAEWLFPYLEFTWHSHEVAHFIGISVPTVTSYIGHKYLTFRQKKPRLNN
jgi:putative flippase GtrA